LFAFAAVLLLQVPLWGELRSCQVPLLLVAGQLDSKFAGIKRRMMARLRQGLSATTAASGSSSSSSNGSSNSSSNGTAAVPAEQQQITHQWAEVPGAGHAVHVEAPLQLLQLITGFTETLSKQQ
jgi:pimeloyl-ACP methyl ester carboxylesterase